MKSQRIAIYFAGSGRRFSLTDILPQAYLDLFANPDIESLVRNMTPIQVQGNTVPLDLESEMIPFVFCNEEETS
ncbi:MAG: hypothetical protein ACLR13_01040 [Acutalibacteraceae bacterium]